MLRNFKIMNAQNFTYDIDLPILSEFNMPPCSNTSTECTIQSEKDENHPIEKLANTFELDSTEPKYPDSTIPADVVDLDATIECVDVSISILQMLLTIFLRWKNLFLTKKLKT